MRVGEGAWARRMQLWVGAAALALAGLMGPSMPARAIDNPDVRDRVAAFERRAEPFEQRLAATDGGSGATRAGAAYAAFLDTELNAAYRLLLQQLDGPRHNALVQAQRKWLHFRDAERVFIAQRWTVERSGTSASLSAAGYGAALVKERVRVLLRYAAET